MSGQLEMWYRRKYNLPPNDPGFLSMTHDLMEIDYWAHHYEDIRLKGGNVIEDEDDDFNVDDVVAQFEREAEAEEAAERETQAAVGAVTDWEDVE